MFVTPARHCVGYGHGSVRVPVAHPEMGFPDAARRTVAIDSC